MGVRGCIVIEAALRLIVGELDQSLRLQTPGPAKLATLSNLVDSHGSPVPDAADKLAVFLVNIEREDIPVRAPRPLDFGEDRLAVRQPPVFLNLLVMFAANFSGPTYNEALKAIADTIAFFQSKPVFNATNTPDLDPGLDRISLEIENLNTTDLSNLWGIFGGRYMPSVLYRLRMLAIDGQQITAQPRRVERTATTLVPSAAR